MKEIRVLSSKYYEDASASNYGDCILIDTGTNLFIYDCGSIEHAKEAIKYMDDHHYEKATLFLSHNDEDHFAGIPYLIEHNRISEIYTVLLLKHVNDILDKIDDKRKTRESTKNEILDTYNNIAQLSGCNLRDIYDDDFYLSDEISIIGPSYQYMVDTVAKRLDGREGNTVDGETAVNATSVQLSVKFNSHNILLCGDSSFNAIESVVRDHDIVQLPHHGKSKQAEQIFRKKWDQNEAQYLVSDNTGNSNGGSDDLDTQGHIVHNTKRGDIKIDSAFFNSYAQKKTGSLGV